VTLSPAEIDQLRAALEELIAELTHALAETAEAARPVALDQPAIGRVSRIDAIQQQKMTEANRASQQARLQLARAALHRLREEEYGDCMACGEAIGRERLFARPDSLYCLECQESRERR
jgi:DnaK suppressor protein